MLEVSRIDTSTLDILKSVTIGIVTALPKEYAAVLLMIRNPREVAFNKHGIGNRYTLGEIPARYGGTHYVVATLLPDMGNNMSAIWATQLINDFPSIRSIIMCGIAGGVFKRENIEHDVRLGDIVVSNREGVVQYDNVKEKPDGSKELRFPPRPPSRYLVDAVRHLQTSEELGQQPWVKLLRDEKVVDWGRPDDNVDARGNPITYPYSPLRTKGIPRVFHGPIAAANTLLKNPEQRDFLATDFGVKAVEMEGSGIADATWSSDLAGYLVVRGICDYCDENKGDVWQRAAALAAAAYTYALIESIPIENIIGYSTTQSGRTVLDKEDYNCTQDSLSQSTHRSSKSHNVNDNSDEKNAQGKIRGAINDFEVYIKNLNDTITESSYTSGFYYKNRITSLIGRKTEIESLEKFCNADETLLWWAITGKGGTGKSRLAYEFILGYKENNEYDMVFLPDQFFQKNFESFHSWTYPRNLFLVIDYATHNSMKIGEFLKYLHNVKLGKKVRILILERQDFDTSTSMYRSDPHWYANMKLAFGSADNLKSFLHTGKFLNIDGINDDALLKIAKEYIRKYGENKYEFIEILKKVPDYLRSINGGLCRPLFVLFVAHAICEKQKNILYWDKDRILGWFIEQEDIKMRQIFKTSADSCFKLRAYANAVGEISLKKLPPFLSAELTRIKNAGEIGAFNSIDVYNMHQKSISSMMPDILAEYCFLRHIKTADDNFEHEYLQSLFEYAAENSFYYTFLVRVLQDFPENEYINSECLLRPPSKSNHLLYMILIAKIPELLPVNKANSIIATIEDFVAKADTPVVWTMFAHNLHNLAQKQNTEQCSATIDMLEAIAVAQDTKEIWLVYAQGLSQLAMKQKTEQCYYTIDRLESVAKTHDTSEIRRELVKTLFLLGYMKQDGCQQKDIIDRMYTVAAAQDIQWIWLKFAKSLVEAIHTTDIGPWNSSIDMLETLAKSENTKEFWQCLAEGLVNLSRNQDAKQCSVTLERLEKLAKTQDTEEIWNLLADELAWLASKQDVEQCQVTIKKLETIAVAQDTKKTWEMLACGLAYLALILVQKQDIAQCCAITSRLEIIAAEQNTKFIWEMLASTLMCLSSWQDTEQCTATIRKIETIAKEQDTLMIWEQLARGLVYSLEKQDVEWCRSTINKLEELANVLDTNEIWLLLAEGLGEYGLKLYRLGQISEAEVLLLKSFNLRSDYAGVILALMKMRNELSISRDLSVEFYLEKALDEGYTIAVIIWLLHQVTNKGVVWENADRIISDMSSEVNEIAEELEEFFWEDWCHTGKPDSLLVLIWFERHGYLVLHRKNFLLQFDTKYASF